MNTRFLYMKIVDQMLKKIQYGEYKPGDMLPSENDLSEQFGVSRVTVIKALNELKLKDLENRNIGRAVAKAASLVICGSVQGRTWN